MRRSIVGAVSVRIGCGLSTDPDPAVGTAEAAAAARAGLGGRPADLAVVFATGSHLAAPEVTLEGVHDTLAPEQLIGCGAGGVLADGREVEEGTAVVVWTVALGTGSVEAFHAEVVPSDEGALLTGMPELDGAAAGVLLPDPYTFPTEAVLEAMAEHAPGVPLLGGLASGRTYDDEAALFLGDRILDGGAVGLRFDGVELLPCVSQGAAPLGPELAVTASEGMVIHELAGRPALTALRDAISDLTESDRRRVAEGLLLGLVIERGKPEYVQGDFLVRGIVGADGQDGSVAIGRPVSPGQVVRVHVRDADSADRDLHDAMALRRTALGGGPPAGALVFSCNGRGRGMFGSADHDAAAISSILGPGVPAAGFFAAGEIGPIGGASFLHGFTATVALFAG
jgi:small ligand-binding sensory domain FIST